MGEKQEEAGEFNQKSWDHLKGFFSSYIQNMVSPKSSPSKSN